MILTEEQAFRAWLAAADTPTRTDGEHRHEGQRLDEPRLFADVPAKGECGEVTPALVVAELRTAVATDGEVCHIACLVGVVCRIGEVDAAPLSATGADVLNDTFGSRAGDAS